MADNVGGVLEYTVPLVHAVGMSYVDIVSASACV